MGMNIKPCLYIYALHKIKEQSILLIPRDKIAIFYNAYVSGNETPIIGDVFV